MKYRMSDVPGNCCFEIYEGVMKPCGEKTHITCGKKFICEEHLPSVVERDRKPQFFNAEGKEVFYLERFKAVIKAFKPAYKKEDAWSKAL